MTDRHNHINKDLMEMLQMLKFRLKSGAQLDFLTGLSCNEVIEYVESIMDAESAIPDNISVFIQSLLLRVQNDNV